jgi:phenylalanyl-tRNA synthetase beta chain
MKLSYNWLNDFADFNSIPFEKIHEKISLSISEIDEVTEYMEFMESIVSAKIIETQKHPDADKLTVTIADTGSEKIQIVTGARVEVGQIVPLAKLGTVFPDGKEIKEGKLRGVDSFGMYCSEKELTLQEESEGLFQLSPDTKLGVSLRKLLDLEDKIILIDNKSITHRPDLWSHFGFARELAAQLNLKLKYNPFQSKFTFSDIESPKVVETENCHSYYAVSVQGLETKPSIQKFSSRINRCGIKSINNIVDVSNYVMLEMGQPTHFFDANRLGKVELKIEFAKEKETLAVLDKTTRELNPKILTIRNQDKPVAIAGIMGGEESSIEQNTKNAILESACFPRETIRKSIKETGIRTESAMRYEKGLDSNSSLPVIHRALELLKENGGGDFKASQPSGFQKKPEDVFIETSFSFLNQKLGTIFEEKIILSVLERLGFQIEQKGDLLKIKVPSYRQNYDITIPEDIVEEVGRSLGYAAIDYKPSVSNVKPVAMNSHRSLERKLKTLFAFELGFHEVFHYSFASQKDTELESNSSEALEIANTMPEEHKFLRTSIYPSIIHHLQSNLDRFSVLKIFEYGRTYHKVKKEELASENRFFGFGYASNLKTSSLEEDFIQIRSQITSLLSRFTSSELKLELATKSYFHPNASLVWKLENQIIAEMGILHPLWGDQYDCKKNLVLGKIYFLELEKVLNQAKGQTFQAPSAFPSGQLDISLLMNEEEPTETFVNSIYDLNLETLDEFWVHSLFRGGNIPEGKKSVTYRANLLNYKETFTQQSIQEILNQILKLAKKKNYELR